MGVPEGVKHFCMISGHRSLAWSTRNGSFEFQHVDRDIDAGRCCQATRVDGYVTYFRPSPRANGHRAGPDSFLPSNFRLRLSLRRIRHPGHVVVLPRHYLAFAITRDDASRPHLSWGK